MASPKIQIKRGTTTPLVSDFSAGELALNTTANTLYAQSGSLTAASPLAESGTFTIGSVTSSVSYLGVVGFSATMATTSANDGVAVGDILKGTNGSPGAFPATQCIVTVITSSNLLTFWSSSTPTAGTVTLVTRTTPLKWIGAEIENTLTVTNYNKLVTQAGISAYVLGLGYGNGSGDMSLAGTQTVTGAKSFDSGTLKYKGSTSGTTTLNASAVASTTTLTLPAADDTLVGKQTTDTLTNKTISGGGNTITDIANASLTYSAVTIGSTSVALGATATTIAGLTSVSSTGFTGTLTGNASTATSAATLTTPRAIYGNNFDGSAALTGAIAGTYGGTGVNNDTKTITLGGNLSTSGAHATTLTTTAATSVTLPTTGTLATLAGTENLTNKTLTSPSLVTPALGAASATSINKVTITAPETGSTITVADGKTLTASNTLTFTGTDSSSVAFGAGGTVVYTNGNIGTATGTSLVLSGDLTVNGTTTTINSSTLTVNDKNIELGSVSAEVVSTTGTIGTVSSPHPYTATITGMSSTSGLIPGQTITATDAGGNFGSGTMTVGTIVSTTSITISSTLTFTAGAVTNITSVAANNETANGGGITLKGTTDKTITWDSVSQWTSSENWNIATGKAFRIASTSVLNATTLGSGVVASSLTSVGTLSALTVNGTNVGGISFTKSGYHTSNSAVTIYNNNAGSQNASTVSAPPTLVLKAAHELDGPSFENVIRFENVDVDIGQIGIDNSKTFFFSAVRGTRNFSVTNTGVVEDCTIDCGTYT
jgi:hypothetical protein